MRKDAGNAIVFSRPSRSVYVNSRSIKLQEFNLSYMLSMYPQNQGTSYGVRTRAVLVLLRHHHLRSTIIHRRSNLREDRSGTRFSFALNVAHYSRDEGCCTLSRCARAEPPASWLPPFHETKRDRENRSITGLLRLRGRNIRLRRPKFRFPEPLSSVFICSKDVLGEFIAW
jgi:hypothetical protein